jgi:hypothetical protein
MKKVRNTIYLIGLSIVMMAMHSMAGDLTPEHENKKGDWRWLFKKSSTEAWHGVSSDEFPDQGWKVENGVLTVLGNTDERKGGQSIVTYDKFGNFELQLEVKLSKAANSGIKYLVTDQFPGHQGNYLGLEYQLLDDKNHKNAKNHAMSSLYDLIAPPEDLKTKPYGKWNKVKIIVDGNQVEHWLNGQKVLEYNRMGDAFTALVKTSKYKDLKNFGQLDEGHILLQGHGQKASFRKIKIREW